LQPASGFLTFWLFDVNSSYGRDAVELICIGYPINWSKISSFCYNLCKFRLRPHAVILPIAIRHIEIRMSNIWCSVFLYIGKRYLNSWLISLFYLCLNGDEPDRNDTLGWTWFTCEALLGMTRAAPFVKRFFLEAIKHRPWQAWLGTWVLQMWSVTIKKDKHNDLRFLLTFKLGWLHFKFGRYPKPNDHMIKLVPYTGAKREANSTFFCLRSHVTALSTFPDEKVIQAKWECQMLPVILLFWKSNKCLFPGQWPISCNHNYNWGLSSMTWYLKLSIQVENKMNEIFNFTPVVDDPLNNTVPLMVCSSIKRINKISQKMRFVLI
jgi:hypothetical protein